MTTRANAADFIFGGCAAAQRAADFIFGGCAAWAGRLSPLRRALVAIVAGAGAALALPPLYVVPALPVALVLLLWLLDGAASGARPRRGTFVLGWCFGFGHFVAGLYWIANALLVDADRFGWLAPIAVAGLSAYFAIYPALAMLVTGTVRAGIPRIVAFSAAWALAEYLRGIVLTGFPWNPLGSVLAFDPALIQGAAWGGVFALSAAVVLIAALPATLAGANAKGRRGKNCVAVAVGLLVVSYLGGEVRLAAAPEPGVTRAEAPRVRVVQGDIPQAIKWRPELVREHFGIYLRLSRQGLPPGGAGNATAPAPVAVIWPETAVPAVYEGSADFTRAVAQAAPPGGIVITGVVRREAATASGGRATLWNSVIAVDGTGGVLARYDKHHLVPFGEYVPLARFNPLPKLTEGRVDFSAGPGPVTLALPGLPPTSPLVCYEAIFPGAVTKATAPRAGLLLNLTNDAWFGAASGPYQHLVAARLRAVEEGLPLIRAANTGISGLIDPYGRLTASLGLGRRGVLDLGIPDALEAPTAFARHGNMPFLVFDLAILVLAMVWRRLRP